MVISAISACGPGPAEPVTESQTLEPTPAESGDRVIKAWTFNYELQWMAERYVKMHPDFGYTFEWTYPESYEYELEQALPAGNGPDIYCAESAYVIRFTQGDMSGYALPYEELGIDVGEKLKKAKLYQYIVDIGTRTSDNAVVGLAYQSTPGAFIYRRSLAKEVWGTDDPEVIKTKIGPGWEKFFEAAAELKEKGISIVSGDGDIWHSVESSADKGWVVDGKLYIDPKREAFLDHSKRLLRDGYSNDNKDWTDGWFVDMAGAGQRPVFGFFGPAWMINYVMAGNCGSGYYENDEWVETGTTLGDWAICEPTVSFFWGGTWVFANKSLSGDPGKKAAVADFIDWVTLQYGKDSMQYEWANGTLRDYDNTKDTVGSCAVMEISDGTLPFLGGQDMFDVFIPAGQDINARNVSQYDMLINTAWRDAVSAYAHGGLTRDEAIAAFKQAVKEQLGFESW